MIIKTFVISYITLYRLDFIKDVTKIDYPNKDAHEAFMTMHALIKLECLLNLLTRSDTIKMSSTKLEH